MDVRNYAFRWRGGSERKTRRGTVVMLAALFLTALLALVAFAVDLGYLLVERAQLQRAADSAAMAAAWELADEGLFKGDPNLTEAINAARILAKRFAGENDVGSIAPDVDLNAANTAGGDVVIGYMQDLFDANGTLDTSDPRKFNAVRVYVHRDSIRNGRVPSFFARALGVGGFDAQAKATAALASDISGFKVPLDRRNISILPLVLDEATWNDMAAGVGNDVWGFNEQTGEVVMAGDDIPECDLYPRGNGIAGFRGVVDIGGLNNATSSMAQQVLDGISAEDLEYHGGELKLDSSGEIFLEGDAGISAAFKEELMAIVGEPRMIPVFSVYPDEDGDDATYCIVKFCGVRVVDVELSGRLSDKRIIVQPCATVSHGTIYGEQEGGSSMIFTPVRLIR
jgi:hypothetical protein